MNTVACVLRSGGRYGLEYVHRLADGLARHEPSARFVCFTDLQIPGISTVELSYDWPGWWAKMHLFRPGLFRGGVLYLDLDTVIVGDPKHLLRHTADVPLVLADFDRPNRMIGTGIMLWSGDAMAPVWTAFMQDPDDAILKYPIRMDHFIYDHLPEHGFVQDVFRRQVISYRYKGPWRTVAQQRRPDIVPRGIPGGARLVCMHGTPTLEDLSDDDPVKQRWIAG